MSVEAPPQPAPAQQAPVTSQTPSSSSLGGPSEIKSRLDAFMKGEKPSDKKPEQQPKEKAQLPIEKKVEEKKPEAQEQKGGEQKQDESRGTDGMTAEQRKAFLENKKAAEESKTRLAELEQKLKDHEITAKERDELKQRLEAREKEFDYVEKEMAVVRLQKTKAYQENIEKPMRELVGSLNKIATSAEVSLDSILDAVENPNEVEGNAFISEVVEKLDPLTARKMERIVDDVRKLNQQAEHLHANAEAAWKAAQLEEQSAKETETKKSKEIYNRSFDSVIDTFKRVDPTLVKDGELTPEAKAAFDEARAVDWEKTPPDMKAYFAQAGYLLLAKNELADRQAKEIESLKATIEKLTKKPGISSSSPTPQSTESDEVKGEKPGDRFRNWRFGA